MEEKKNFYSWTVNNTFNTMSFSFDHISGKWGWLGPIRLVRSFKINAEERREIIFKDTKLFYISFYLPLGLTVPRIFFFLNEHDVRYFTFKFLVLPKYVKLSFQY